MVHPSHIPFLLVIAMTSGLHADEVAFADRERPLDDGSAPSYAVRLPSEVLPAPTPRLVTRPSPAIAPLEIQQLRDLLYAASSARTRAEGELVAARSQRNALGLIAVLLILGGLAALAALLRRYSPKVVMADSAPFPPTTRVVTAGSRRIQFVEDETAARSRRTPAATGRVHAH